MIARTLSFGSPGRLFVRDEQLVYEDKNNERRTFPIEDLGFVLIESEQITLSATCLRKLSESNVATIICNATHTPSAQLFPFAAHSTSQETVSAQLAASDAVQGRLWRQIVRQKILNQASLLELLNAPSEGRRLRTLANEVKNRDPANCEAQAARVYFQTLMPPHVIRDPDGAWPNAPLNYGYAILRAAVARALVGSGLLCLKGIHHHNRYNPFCLADDIMEPYRPFVDQYVLGKVKPFDVPLQELTQPMRARLLQMLTCDVKMGNLKRPLMVALSYTTASLSRYYRGETDKLVLPSFLE